MSKFEQFFASNKVMTTAFVVTLIAFAVYIVMNSIFVVSGLPNIFYLAFGIIMFFIVLSMYRSFAKHETNAMNIVTGATIGILLIFSIQISVSSLAMDMSLSFNAVITCIIEAALYTVLLINHVQINSIHRSTRGRIVLNQVILMVVSAYQIYIIIASNIDIDWINSSDTALYVTFVIVFAVAKIFMCFMIICIETRLNAYKIDRGAAMAEGTWTEEKKAEIKEKYFGK